MKRNINATSPIQALYRHALSTGLIILCFTVSANAAEATSQWEHNGRAYIYLEPIWGGEVKGTRRTVEIGSGWVIGLGGHRCINDYLSLGVDAFLGMQDRTARHGRYSASIDGGDLKGINLNTEMGVPFGRVRPFITGGIGYLSFSEGDSQVEWIFPGGSIEVDRLMDGLTESHMSYNAGVGIRYSIAGGELSIMYRSTWTRLDDTDAPVMMPSLHIAGGVRF
jgi:hypothetical protein